MSEKRIEITSGSGKQQVVLSSQGIQIEHRGKPVSTRMAGTGYAYLANTWFR